MPKISESASESALESRARRAAKRVGLRATKSRWRRDSIDNLGGFMLVDPYINGVINGSRYDLSAADVIELCSDSDQS
jgi:hypothetical protein